MIPTDVRAVYVTEWAAANPNCEARIARLSAAMGHPQPPVLTAGELATVARERHWLDGAGKRTGESRGWQAPDVLLNAFIWDEQQAASIWAQYPELRRIALSGASAITYRNAARQRQQQGCVCQSAYEVHSAHGCLHACTYCHVGTFINILCNLEELAAHVEMLMAEHPWLKLFKYDNQTDTICFEPEYGASQVMVSLFSRQSDRYLLLYTKSDNVEHLLDLDHRGHTLISWSLAGPTSARLIERGTPPMEARIEAMRRCQEAGYRVRARLSPICPVEGWREEARQLVEALFAQVRPELLTMDVLGWMNARQMLAAMDVSLFEARFRDYVMQKAEEPPPPHQKHFFPHEWRLEILRHYLREIRRVSPNTPVSICMETLPMWEALGPELGMSPEHYACCCGPTSVPGHPLLGP